MVPVMAHPLRQWLDAKPETQEAFASRVGISRMQLWRILSGEIPSRKTAMSIEAATDGKITAIRLLGLERRADDKPGKKGVRA